MPYGSIMGKKIVEEYHKEKKLNSENYIEFGGNYIIIMVCSNCNIRCEHCYISYIGNRDSNELLDLVNNLKCKYNIELNGSEVLTNLDYLKAYKVIGQHHILSNGKAILENPLAIEKLKDNGITTVALSYHFGIQENISMVKEEELLKIMKLLKDNGIEYRFMTTITSDNHSKIIEMCDNAYNLGARAIKFTNYISQGNAMQLDKNNILTDEQKKYFFEKLLEARAKYNKEDLLIERCGSFGKNNFNGKDNFNCDCITKSVVLTPDNNIYPCVFLAKPGFEIGKYVDGKILIDNKIENNIEKCLVDEICNKGKKLVRRYE